MAELVLQGVSKTFGRGDAAVAAVSDVSLSVSAGEVVVVMGPSGSGKTTLLAIAGCLLTPDAGQVLIGGRDVTRLSQTALAAVRRQEIGFIFQSFNLLSSLTALENVQLVAGLAGKAGNGRSAELLAQLGVGGRATFLPEKLSGGEKQRVAIARALAGDPRIILADEPTANLDSRSGQQVAALLAAAARERGKAVVIVSHDARLKSIADRLVWMEDGRLTEQ